MSNKAFEVGDRVRVIENVFHQGPASMDGNTGIVRSVDKDRRRTDPYYIYYVELSGEDRLTDFEYRELELVVSASDELKVRD
jgi:transcription antitermination factor NusG